MGPPAIVLHERTIGNITISVRQRPEPLGLPRTRRPRREIRIGTDHEGVIFDEGGAKFEMLKVKADALADILQLLKDYEHDNTRREESDLDR